MSPRECAPRTPAARPAPAAARPTPRVANPPRPCRRRAPPNSSAQASPAAGTRRTAESRHGAEHRPRQVSMNSLRDPGLVVALGLAVLVCDLVASRIRIAPPVVLLVCGALLGFVPALRSTHLPPSAVLLLFLPALLYWESLTTSLREIRRYLRVIVLSSTALIAVTAAAVAAAGHAFGLPWGPAWVLGAALAPSDATAVGVRARGPARRTAALLRAESLVNDGTALVIYGLAVGVTIGEEHLGVAHVAWLTVLAYGGGIAAGALVALVNWQVRRGMGGSLLGEITHLCGP